MVRSITDKVTAHRCMGKSVMGQIMSRFYHPLWHGNKGYLAPHILGLTASPVMRANVKELEFVESPIGMFSEC